MDDRDSDRRAWVVALLLAVAFFVQGYSSSAQQSITWDETDFIAAGYAYLTAGDFRLNASHPPLMQELEALPLLFMDLNAPSYPSDWLERPNPVLAYASQLLYQSGNDVDRIAFWARLPVLVLGALLVLGIFLWGRALFGRGPALVATAAAAFCPNLIAHSKLATEDLGCSAWMFAAVATFWLAWREQSLLRFGLCGVVTGAALLSKYTALLLGPIDLVLALWLFWRCAPAVRPRTALLGLSVAGVVALLVVGAGYNLTFAWGSYLSGLRQIYGDLDPGWSHYTYYLLGSVSDRPSWAYNLIGLATKLPASTLLLLVMAAVTCVRERANLDRVVVLLVPVAIVIGASLFDKMNLGLRRILPALPFLLLFSAHALGEARRPLRVAAVVLLLVLTAADTLRIYPYHLSYFNPLAGGPERGPELFDDSNVDWGQDLPALATWQRAHPEAKPLKLWYFGTAAPSAYGVEAVAPAEAEVQQPQPGFYAVSANMLVAFRKAKLVTGADVDWLTKYRPVARAGYSIYLYRFQSDAGRR